MVGRAITSSPSLLKKSTGAGKIGTSNGSTVEAEVGSRVKKIALVSDISALVPDYNGQQFILGGYNYAGKGGGQLYYDGADTTTAADNVMVFVTAGGHRIKRKETGFIHAYDGGAFFNGIADDYVALQRCVNALPVKGGTVWMPAGKANLSQQLILGNGNGGSTASTKNGIKLIGAGGGFAAAPPTELSWTGALTQNPMLNVAGQISGVELRGFFVACNQLCGGIALKSFSQSKFADLKIVGPSANSTALNILGGTAPTGNYNIFNSFENIHIALSTAGSTGLFMDGDYASVNDSWISTFDRIRIETLPTASSANCAWFKFVDSCTFTRCHFDSSHSTSSTGGFGTGTTNCTGIVFDSTTSAGYPGGLSFYDCSVFNHAVSGTTMGKCYFYGFGVYDNETIPTHPFLCGITATGEVFGQFSGFKNKSVNDITAANTASGVDIYQYTLQANMLVGQATGSTPSPKNGMLRVSIVGEYLNNSGSNKNLTFTALLGGSTLIQFVVNNIPSNAAARSVSLELLISPRNTSITQQTCKGSVIVGDTGSAGGFSASAPFVSYSAVNSALAVNLAAAQSLNVAVQHSAAAATVSFVSHLAVLELL